MIRLLLAFFVFTTVHAEEKFVPVLDGTLYCDIIGKGEPILIIHGAPALNQTYLRPALDTFADSHQVIFYDQRGCGRSTGLNNIKVRTYLDDIEAIRKDLGVEKVNLIGHSWGGFLAMHYAIAHPQSVEKMVLIGTMPASKEELDQFFAVVMNRLAPIHKELEEIEESESYKSGDPDTVEKQLKTVFGPYFYKPDDVAKVNFRLTQTAFLNGSKVFAKLVEEVFFKPYDLYPQLKEVKAPTLVVHGDYDPIPYELGEKIAKSMPNARFVKLENCGHFTYAEKPDATFKAINDFLTE